MKIAIPVEALVDELNDHQKEAVEAPDGPLLIFAGAGSGKTKVLTHKIAYMLATGKAEPYQICAVTFTNKAAREMKERLEKLVGFEPMGMWLGTFHALGSKLLREHPAEIGRKNGFTIFDDGDSTRVLRESINDSGVDLGDLSMAQMIEICRTYISYAKDQLDSPADCLRKATAANNLPEINGAKVYELYERKLLAANGVDFDDLIKLPVDMFQNFPHILDKYREQYKYLLVDEYQDTSRAQYSLVTQLASHHRNITVVGDDSQSIYGWRGADIRNILSFSKDYPDAKTITLDQNYRSTQIILDAAYGVIKHNKVRVDKKLWSEVKEGEPIYLLLAENDIHEALIVSDEIQKLVDKGHSYKDFAILYRTNAQSRAFEDVFVRRQIPYKVAGGLKFYARKEIKDALAYLQLLANPSNVMAFKRIMDVTEGIGRKTASVVEAQAYEKDISIIEAAQRDDVILKIPKAARGPLKKFAEMMTKHKERSEHESLGEIFNSLMDESGYRERLVNLPAHEHEKLDNFDTLVGLAKEGYDDVQPPNGLYQFLENAALISSTDEVDATNEDAVTLITMHQSKGLEYLIVFISGMEEKIFPLWRTLEEDPSAAEERRLAYVAITRAQRRLYVNYSRQRNLYGQTKDYKPSRFFNEIPKHLMKRLPSLSLVRYLKDEGRNRMAQKQKLMEYQAQVQAQAQAVTLEQEAKPVFET